jgi:hypothetical protein
MAAFDQISAQNFDQDGIGHFTLTGGSTRRIDRLSFSPPLTVLDRARLLFAFFGHGPAHNHHARA